MALPKKNKFIQEVVEPETVKVEQPSFLQEIVEPEIQVPEEPELLVEEEPKQKITIEAKYSHLKFKK
jgi:hypothetical protein